MYRRKRTACSYRNPSNLNNKYDLNQRVIIIRKVIYIFQQSFNFSVQSIKRIITTQIQWPVIQSITVRVHHHVCGTVWVTAAAVTMCHILSELFSPFINLIVETEPEHHRHTETLENFRNESLQSH